MTNQVAQTQTTNIVPVQAIFDVNGVCIGLVGPGGEFFAPPISGDTIVNSTIDSSPIGATTPSTGAFTMLSTTGEAIINKMTTDNANITGGSISGVSFAIASLNNTPIGNTTPSTGAFTTLNAQSVTSTGSVGGTVITASDHFVGSGSGLTGTASGLSIGGNAATATSATTAGSATTAATSTNLAGGAAGSLPYQSAANTTSMLAIGTSGQVLTVSGGVPTWASDVDVAVTSFSAGTTGLTPSSPTSGAVTLGGTLATANGGTNLTSFTSGGAVYATSTSALTTGTLPVASGGTGVTTSTGTGSVVLSNSPTLVTPALGTPSAVVLTSGTGLPLTTGVTGTLPIANGGTNGTSAPTAGAVAYGSGTAYAFTSAGTSGQVLQSNGSGAPTWVTPTAYATATDDTTTNATRYPLFAAVTAGNLSTEYVSSTKYQFNPSTGILTATGFSGSGSGLTSIPNSALTNSSVTIGSTSVSLGATVTTFAGLVSVTSTTFVGALTGNASTATSATTATNATNTAITDDTTTNATVYPTWVTTTTGNLPQKTSSTKLKFNPSTGALTASQLVIAP